MRAGLVAALSLWGCNDQHLVTLPEACEAPLTAGPVVPRAGCRDPAAVSPVADPWDVRVLWSWPPPDDPLHDVSAVSPAITGPLRDTNGDGAVTIDDDTVVLQTFSREDPDVVQGIVALDGRSGRALWTNTDGPVQTAPAIADIDGDGAPEILVVDVEGHLLALDGGTGDLRWQSDALEVRTHAVPFVADLDGDGTPEVLAGGAVLSGEDGSTRFTLPRTSIWSMMTAADLDLDGTQEVLWDGIVATSQGDELWEAAEAGEEPSAIVLQADDDDEAEVGWLGYRSFSLYDHDGALIRTIALPERDSQAPACAADFDGDGQAELAWTEAGMLRLRGLDGDVRWEVPADDDVLTTPCSGFDVDGDGVPEVLYSDRTSFRILRGADGAILYRDDTHRSETGLEYPTVADVDRDGHAEILLSGSGDAGVVRALTSAGAGWPSAGPSWGAWDYAVTNANAGGHVPRSPEPSWLAYDMWRARPAAEGAALADLRVDASSCEDSPRVRVAIENRGTADVTGPVDVALRDGDTEIARVTFDGAEGGEREDGVLVEVPSGLTAPNLVIDPDAAIRECDETNNGFALSP